MVTVRFVSLPYEAIDYAIALLRDRCHMMSSNGEPALVYVTGIRYKDFEQEFTSKFNVR